MANYSLVSNAKFSPLTFEELMTPALMATQEHQKLEDEYTEYETNASVWEGMIDKNIKEDLPLVEQQQKYLRDLEAQRDILSNNGLSPTSRREMQRMKARYAREITPIEKAYELKQADIKRQQQVSDSTGGKTLFTRQASTTPLSSYMKGVADYGQVNLEDVYKRGMAGATAMASRKINTEEAKIFNDAYYDLVTTKGYSEEDAYNFLMSATDEKGNYLFPELYELKSSIYDEFGADKYSYADRDRLSNAAMQGIMAGLVYSEEHKPIENYPYKMQEEYNHQSNLLSKKADTEFLNALRINNLKLIGTGYHFDVDKKTKQPVLLDSKNKPVADEKAQEILKTFTFNTGSGGGGGAKSSWGKYDPSSGTVYYPDGRHLTIDNETAQKRIEKLTANGEDVKVVHDIHRGIVTIETRNGTKDVINVDASTLTTTDVGKGGRQLLDILNDDYVIYGDLDNGQLDKGGKLLVTAPTIESSNQGKKSATDYFKRVTQRLTENNADWVILSSKQKQDFLHANKTKLKANNVLFSDMSNAQLDKVAEHVDIVLGYRAGLTDNEWIILPKGTTDLYSPVSESSYMSQVNSAMSIEEMNKDFKE